MANEKEHGHEQKTLTIIVNTREITWDKKEITYDEVAKLAYPAYPEGESIVYTVSFSRGESPRHEGTMVKGDSVKVKNGMVFNVVRSDKS